MSFKEVTSLRKEGKLSEALSMALADFEQSADKWTASALFWVYYALSKADDKLGIENWKIGSEMLSLGEYMPGEEIVEKNLSVAVVRMACDCARRFKSSSVASDDEMAFLKSAQKRFPDEVFLIRALALGYSSRGEKDKAISLFRRLLKVKNDAYLWAELYDFIEDDSLRLSVLCKALLHQPKPEYTGKIRQKLACVLIRAKDYAHAAYELEVFRETYLSNSWALGQEYSRIAGHIPPGVRPVKTGTDFYSANTARADSFVFEDLPQTQYVPVVLKERTNRKGKKVKEMILAELRGRVIFVPVAAAKVSEENYRDFSYLVRSEKLPKGGRRIISCEKSQDSPSWATDIRHFEGEAKFKTDRNGARFALVGKCFVAPQMVSRLAPDKTSISGVALRKNGKWRAIYLF